MEDKITHKELIEYCKYNPISGIFIKNKNGSRIGFFDKSNGHRILCLNGKKYQETRIAVFFITGAWPIGLVKNNSKNKKLNTKFKNLEFEINAAIGHEETINVPSVNDLSEISNRNQIFDKFINTILNFLGVRRLAQSTKETK